MVKNNMWTRIKYRFFSDIIIAKEVKVKFEFMSESGVTLFTTSKIYNWTKPYYYDHAIGLWVINILIESKMRNKLTLEAKKQLSAERRKTVIRRTTNGAVVTGKHIVKCTYDAYLEKSERIKSYDEYLEYLAQVEKGE